jgi:hypothetical protein
MKKILFVFCTIILSFQRLMAETNDTNVDKFKIDKDTQYGGIKLSELHEIDSVSDFDAIISQKTSKNFFLKLTYSLSPSKRYIFFACDTLTNKESIIFGSKISIKDNEVQFIYDSNSRTLIDKGFKYCYSMFTYCTWYENDNLLVMDSGTSGGRGLVIYDIKKRKEIYNGGGLTLFRKSGNHEMIIFNDKRDYIALESFTDDIPDIAADVYFTYIIIINLNNEKTVKIKSFDEKIQNSIIGFNKDELIYERFILDKRCNKIFKNENDKRLSFKYRK